MSRTIARWGIAWFVLAGSVLGCSSNSNDAGDGGTGDSGAGNQGSASAVEQRLAACPIVSTSSDPAASACLAGTYSGTTLAGAACSLVHRADNSFDFTSPTLTFSFTPASGTILIFDHSNVQGSQQVIWQVSDPNSLDVRHELKLLARFGAYVADGDRKVQIDATERTGTSSSTTTSCVVTL